MTFAYPQVELNSILFTTYATEIQADQYLLASISATNWQAIPTTDHLTKGRALVTATRWLDVQQWQGSLVDPAQEHAYPRTGLTYPDGLPVTSTALPMFVVQGEIELANALVDDPTLMTTLHQVLPREIHAGPAGMSFFRPSSVQVLTPLPSIIMNIVGPYLQGTVSGPTAKGTHTKPHLDRDFDFLRGI